MKRIIVALILLFIFPVASAVYADNSGKKTKKHYQEQQKEKKKYRKPGDRGNHYGWDNRKKHPPEGWRDQVSKGKRIETELSIYLEDVPREIVRTLPPLPSGVSYKRIENDIIKFHNANMEILEVFRDFGLPVPVLPKIK